MNNMIVKKITKYLFILLLLLSPFVYVNAQDDNQLTGQEKQEYIEELKKILATSEFNERFEANSYDTRDFEYEETSSTGGKYVIRPESVEAMIKELEDPKYSADNVKNILDEITTRYHNNKATDGTPFELDKEIVYCLKSDGCIDKTERIKDPRVGTVSKNDLYHIIELILYMIARLIPVVIGIGIILFIWGVIKYVISTGPQDKKDAVGVIVYGVISLFVMVSVWGLIILLDRSFFPGGRDATIAPVKIPYETFTNTKN